MSELLSDGQSGNNGEVTPQSTPQQTPQQGQVDSGNQGGGTVYDLGNDSMIRVPGEKEPVKYSEYIKRFVPQADFTRAQQAKAAELADAKRQLAQFQNQSRQQPQQTNQPNPINKLVSDLKSKPYITGEDAASMMTNLWEGGIVNLGKAISQRDQVINLLYQRLMGVDNTVGSLNSASREASFKQKMASVKQSMNLPDDPAVDEIMQDIYLSHEGEDLDREFPNLVKARWDALQKLIRASDQKRATDARQQTLRLPNRGGNGTPSRPAKQPFKNARDLADELFPALQGGNT